ncbi:MAG: sulfur carrier protein ThiS [Oscillospiraceae bacterium]|nr:sulfur carrier protein ThiS [Oscillospiraceae bacterium]
MQITVTGKRKELPDGTTVEQLLSLEQVDMPEYVTVTVNNDFIQTADRAAKELHDGDVVEFLYFMGGGC